MAGRGFFLISSALAHSVSDAAPSWSGRDFTSIEPDAFVICSPWCVLGTNGPRIAVRTIEGVAVRCWEDDSCAGWGFSLVCESTY
jgi:hypothetical protein